jgi:hypothetical protein
MDNNTQQVRYFDIYCKIPFTEVTGTFRVQSNMTITQFLEYANADIRNNLNIHSYYAIEVVQTGKPGVELAEAIEPTHEQTLEERYGNIYNAGNLVAFYIRPVNPVTREFIRRVDYSLA